MFWVSGYVLMLYNIYLGTKKDVDGVRRLGVFGLLSLTRGGFPTAHDGVFVCLR